MVLTHRQCSDVTETFIGVLRNNTPEIEGRRYTKRTKLESDLFIYLTFFLFFTFYF